MTKLKTVKDLQSNFAGSISTGELKEEAIKDYKYYAKKVSQRKPIDNVLDYIKQKNNLTDGDLK